MSGTPRERELQASIKEKERELRVLQSQLEDKDDLLSKAKVRDELDLTLLDKLTVGRRAAGEAGTWGADVMCACRSPLKTSTPS